VCQILNLPFRGKLLHQVGPNLTKKNKKQKETGDSFVPIVSARRIFSIGLLFIENPAPVRSAFVEL
jgi:hypothetical protein